VVLIWKNRSRVICSNLHVTRETYSSESAIFTLNSGNTGKNDELMEQTTRLFLSKEQLTELTGYVRRADQRRRLGELGLPFKPGRDGVPLVLREVVESEFGLRQNAGTRRSTPDLAALRELTHG